MGSLMLLVAGSVQAVAPASTCDSQCQAQQGSAVQRVLQGLLGPGQSMDVFSAPPGVSVYAYMNFTAMAAAGFPAHCFLPGTSPQL